MAPRKLIRKKVKKRKGGGHKFSDISGAISGISGALSATPLAPFALPLSVVSGLATGIAKLFGGSLSKAEHDKLLKKAIKHRISQRKRKR